MFIHSVNGAFTLVLQLFYVLTSGTLQPFLNSLFCVLFTIVLCFIRRTILKCSVKLAMFLKTTSAPKDTVWVYFLSISSNNLH